MAPKIGRTSSRPKPRDSRTYSLGPSTKKNAYPTPPGSPVGSESLKVMPMIPKLNLKRLNSQASASEDADSIVSEVPGAEFATPSATPSSVSHAAPSSVGWAATPGRQQVGKGLLDGKWTVVWDSGQTNIIHLLDGKWELSGKSYQLASFHPPKFDWSDGTVQIATESSSNEIIWTTTNPKYKNVIWKKESGLAATPHSVAEVAKKADGKVAAQVAIIVRSSQGYRVGIFLVEKTSSVVELKVTLEDECEADFWHQKLFFDGVDLHDGYRWCQLTNSDKIELLLRLNSRAALQDDTIKQAVKDISEGSQKKAEAERKFGSVSRWDTSAVTKMDGLFRNLTEFNEDVSRWDVSNVKTMSRCFCDATSFNGDLSAWNVSNVTNMYAMFRSAKCFNGDLSAWDVSNVKDMSWMFEEAKSFKSDLSTWNVRSVSDMSRMFLAAASFNGDVSAWDVSRVTDMREMFRKASSFNGDLSQWDVSQVINIWGMFGNCHSFISDLSAWNVRKVRNMRALFSGARSFNSDLSTWNLRKVTDMNSMFHDARSFNGDLSAWNVASVTDMRHMFHDASSFNRDLSQWNVSSVTKMASMFYGAVLFSGDLSNWRDQVDDVDVLKGRSMSPVFRLSPFDRKALFYEGT